MEQTQKTTLNEIVNRFHNAEELMFASGGELTPEIIELLADNAETLNEKLDNYAEWISYCKGQQEYAKRQADEWMKRAKTLSNAVETARERMTFAMVDIDETSIKTTRHTYSVRKTESWKVKDDISNLTQKYLVANKLAEFVFKPSISSIKEFNKGFDLPEYIEVTTKNSLTIR